MESVDRAAMSTALHPELVRRKAGGVGERELHNVIAASAEGYAFPTNLDRDQPVGGLAPQTQAELLWQAVRESWDTATLTAALDAHAQRRTARA
jgi:ectoine hydroxylase-related dioxygenase (phytanoyl-CoA dioxygenase family)